MKKIILAILMITSILTLSEEKTITENNGTLIKKYNSDGILMMEKFMKNWSTKLLIIQILI